MIGRQVEIVPGSYQRVVCIGAGALRLYSYVGDVSLLCGVEDIDNTTLEERPKMFDGVARPYVMVYGDTFAALPSCGVGGPNAQAAEAEKILSCTPDIIVSEYEDTDKAEALQQQVGVPVITLRTGVDGVFSEDFSGSITLLGQVFGKETRASELLAFVSTETADIQARTADIAEDSKPAVYICGLGNWGTTNHLMTIESYSTFTVANIKNTVSGLSAKGVQPIEAEKFTALGPDMDIMLIDAAAVKNMIANLTGMICDGAKPSCSMKLTSGVSTAVISAMMAMDGHCVTPVEGIIEEDVDKCIRNLTAIGRDGMNETDRVVLGIMTHKC